jgi:hypothetical protein
VAFQTKESGGGIFWISADEFPAQATLRRQQHTKRAIAAQWRHLIILGMPLSSPPAPSADRQA